MALSLIGRQAKIRRARSEHRFDSVPVWRRVLLAILALGERLTGQVFLSHGSKFERKLNNHARRSACLAAAMTTTWGLR